MSPITHLLTGWALANTAELGRRDRALVTLAGAAPDADSFGLVAELLTRESSRPLLWWSDWHHILGHNLLFSMVVALVAFIAGVRGRVTALLAFTAVHLHLVGDLVGAKGPDGYQWPIPYLYPLSDSPIFVWSGQWELNAWPNFLLTILLLLLALYLARHRGYSPLELISSSADRALVRALRRRFGSGGCEGL